jgi:hypothetical protein
MAAQVVVSPSEAALAQIVVDLADSLHQEIDPGYKVIAHAGSVTVTSHHSTDPEEVRSSTSA